MTIPSNIFRRVDSKLMDVARGRFDQASTKFGREAKPHAAFTVMGIMLTTALFTFMSGIRFEREYEQTVILTRIYQGLLAVLSLGAFAVAIYFWRVYLAMRQEGKNSDINLFFAESASLNRKIVFYVALVPWLIRSIYSYLNPIIIEQEMKRLKYRFYSDYLREVGITVFDNIIFSILFVELIRILIPQTSKWNNIKHFVAVVALLLVNTTIRAIALNITRGHGTM